MSLRSVQRPGSSKTGPGWRRRAALLLLVGVCLGAESIAIAPALGAGRTSGLHLNAHASSTALPPIHTTTYVYPDGTHQCSSIAAPSWPPPPVFQPVVGSVACPIGAVQVAAITVSNDDVGNVTFQIQTTNDPPPASFTIYTGDVRLYLDTDSNPATGYAGDGLTSSDERGADYYVDYQGQSQQFISACGSEIADLERWSTQGYSHQVCGSFKSSLDASTGALTYTINVADLGGTTHFDFWMRDGLFQLPGPVYTEYDLLPKESYQVEISPVLSLPSGPVVEATSPRGAAVSWAATASDYYEASIPTTCSPASGSTFAVGQTTVRCSATDSHNATAEGTFDVSVRDTTPPVLRLPSRGIRARASGPRGARVVYRATAHDLVNGTIAPRCSPPPGRFFRVGTTIVHCLAKDHAGNIARGSFRVLVRRA